MKRTTTIQTRGKKNQTKKHSSSNKAQHMITFEREKVTFTPWHNLSHQQDLQTSLNHKLTLQARLDAFPQHQLAEVLFQAFPLEDSKDTCSCAQSSKQTFLQTRALTFTINIYTLIWYLTCLLVKQPAVSKIQYCQTFKENAI